MMRGICQEVLLRKVVGSFLSFVGNRSLQLHKDTWDLEDFSSILPGGFYTPTQLVHLLVHKTTRPFAAYSGHPQFNNIKMSTCGTRGTWPDRR